MGQKWGGGIISGVARVSSARGPMLASAPPPPPLALAPPLPHRPTRLAPLGLGVPPPPPFGKQKKARGSAGPIAYATFAARLIRHCNDVTLIICLGLIFFLKFAPISWAGAASKACARGPWPPRAPPLATPLGVI